MAYEEMEQDFIDEILGSQLAYSIEISRNSPELVLPNTPTMKLYRVVSGEPLPAALPLALADFPVGNHEFRDGDREYQVAVREADGSRFILLYDWSETEAREAAFSTVVIVSALSLCVLAMILVYAITGRLTLGLETLASRVVEGRGDTPFVQPDMELEMLAVARALDAAEIRQTELLARERLWPAFAAVARTNEARRAAPRQDHHRHRQYDAASKHRCCGSGAPAAGGSERAIAAPGAPSSQSTVRSSSGFRYRSRRCCRQIPAGK
jgi:hypothetical protein